MPSPVSPLCQKFTWDADIIHGAAEGSCRANIFEAEEMVATIEVDGDTGQVTIIELP